MSRRGDYRSFYLLVKMAITLIVTVLFFAFRFLREVYRLNLWSDLFKSLLIAFVYFVIVAGMAQGSQEVAGVFALAGIIYFCYWWHKKFSYADTRLNSAFWQQRQWWWTLDGWQFEHEVARVFRLNGYNAQVTKGSGDGGVDIFLKKDNYRAIVQCKHHQYPLPPEPVRALWGIKDDYNADEVIMVASSGLTAGSIEFVRNKSGYKVLNLDDIIRMSQYVEQKQPKLVQTQIQKHTTTGRKVDF